MNIYYKNHLGKTFTLNGDGRCYVDAAQLHGYEWSYVLTDRVDGMGGMAEGFARKPRAFDLELRLRGFTMDEFLQLANELHAVTDADAMAGQPGRLYLGNQYLRCFLAAAGGVPERAYKTRWYTRTVTVLAVEPFWCTPVSVDISKPVTESTGTVPIKIDPDRYDGYTLYGGSGSAARRWNFSTSEPVQPSSGTYYYAVYELPEGVDKVAFTAYHYSNTYAAAGIYAGEPGTGEKLWVYQSGTNGKIDDPEPVDVPAGATHIVIQMGGALTRGLWAMSTAGKKFDLRHGYRYGTGLAGGQIINSHYAASPMIITFQGPAISPEITIGGTTYAVGVTLTATDRLVIDQTTRRIYTVDGAGAETNAFDLRDKSADIFAPLPAGSSPVVYAGSSPVTVTIIQQRTEPRWDE